MKNRNLIYLLLMPAILIVLSACESDAKIRLINRSSYPIHSTLENQSTVVIPADGEHTYEVDTDTQTFFGGEVEERLWLTLIGETYSVFDHYEEEYVDSTEITVKAGETLNAYLDANRASIKVVNNSDMVIQQVYVYQVFVTHSQIVGIMPEIVPGTERFLRVIYSTPTSQFSYRVIIRDENNISHNFGDNQTVLEVDQQFLINFTGR